MRLCDRDIEAWLDEGRLSINPRPPVERINGATVDVRLGNKFRTFRGHTAAFIDLSGPKDEVSAALDRVMSDEIVLDESEAFYLHPGELALAVTLESVTPAASLPRVLPVQGAITMARASPFGPRNSSRLSRTFSHTSRGSVNRLRI